MTIPEFKPIAWTNKQGDYFEAVRKDTVFGSHTRPLYTSDQLTEAYEAGKLEASEDIEQAAFEKWLYDKCPSGDVESVQRQWLESYEYAELAGKMEQAAQINHLQMALADTEALEAETSARCLKQAAQIEMMREALEDTTDFLERHSNRWDGSNGKHPATIVEQARAALSTTPDQALEQFAAKMREQCLVKVGMLKSLYLSQERPVQETAMLVAATDDMLTAIRAIKELP